jgi:anti-sigma B factor antagonist
MLVPAEPQFTVTSRQVGTTTEIAVQGDLDISTVADLKSIIADALGPAPERVVVDLRAVTFIDSSGLRCLIEAKARAEIDRLDLEVLRPPPPIDRTFELCGLDEIFPVLEAATERRPGSDPAEPYLADWA